MKPILAALLLVFLASAALAGGRMLSGSDTYIIGGELVIPASQAIHGDLRAVFAQVKLDDGARIDGKITAVSSALDLAGSVGGSVVAVNSDVILRASARLVQSPQRITAIPYVILLPGMLRTGYASALVR